VGFAHARSGYPSSPCNHTIILRLVRRGGVRAVVAESVLAKHQLLILNRSRRHAPNLRILDRIIAGFCSLWIQPGRLPRVAIALKPSTFLGFHRAMAQRKYRLLFSPKQKAEAGPKGPTVDLIRAVVEMKQRNTSWNVRKLPSRLMGDLRIRISDDPWFQEEPTGRARPTLKLRPPNRSRSLCKNLCPVLDHSRTISPASVILCTSSVNILTTLPQSNETDFLESQECAGYRMEMNQFIDKNPVKRNVVQD
jgi:hypothetical protein